MNISIHAVLWDRDLSTISKRSRLTYFNPRGPLGPRRIEELAEFKVEDISIHAVLWDRDSCSL